MRTREGEVSLYLPPNFQQYAITQAIQAIQVRETEREGAWKEPGKKEQRKGNKEGDTNTGSKKNQQTIESISEIDKLSRGGWKEMNCAGIQRNSRLVVS